MTGVEGRTAIVTGAGQGLGRAYALALAQAGARVVVNDIGLDAQGRSTAERVAEEILAAGGSALADRNSVATAEGAAAIVDAALTGFGALEIVVSNAGIERNKSYAKSTHEQWREVLDVHLNGTHYLCHAAWPHMIERKHGRLVLVSSPSGLWGNFAQSSYAAAKLGIIGLANVLAIEGRRHNVLANCLAPIATTPMSAGLLAPELAARLAPEHVCAAVLQLASDELDVAGAIIVAGGGWFTSAHIGIATGVEFDHVASAAELDGVWARVLSGEGLKPGAPLDPETLRKKFVGDAGTSSR